ncbi:MAG: right-handed parallel beta-helix repeat-containing protein, partial [Planctomycetota bacterium]
VSVSGDVVVVGAYGDDNLTYYGSAYVFRWNGASWVQEQKFLAAGGAGGDYFGLSVSVSGDVIVVGAPANDVTGSAYVYRWNGASWVQEPKLQAGDGEGADYFGIRVSVSGDLAVVGAYRDDDNGTNSGSAYVFRWNGSSWVEEDKLLASDGEGADEFGKSVSVSGDVAVVGALADDNDNGTNAGAAYVYRWNGSVWVEEDKLLPADGATYDFFGVSVALSGDVAVMGANGDDDNGSASGSAYVIALEGADCNDNGLCDARDIADGTSPDANGNGVPDECENVHNLVQDTYHLTIADAIADANWGDVIMVAPGTYNEAVNFQGKALTLMSSGGPEVTTLDGSGLLQSVVTCADGEDGPTGLSGFTVAHGATDSNGGGMYIRNADPVVFNCIFEDNQAASGGGVYAEDSDAMFSQCAIRLNDATSGGGMGVLQAAPVLTDCVFSDNTANTGGGMFVVQASPTVTDCTFTGNSIIGYGNGGGMCNHSSSPTVTGCTFRGNSATQFGGGMYSELGSPVVTNCAFGANEANWGGGMAYWEVAGSMVTNCAFTGNDAGLGGAMYNYDSDPTVTNCTLSANTASEGGGMCNGTASSPTVANCVFWGNTPDEIHDDTGAATWVGHSDVQGGWPGAGVNNINADPLFINELGPDGTPGTGDENLRVYPGSPCIDDGDNASV